MLGDEVELIWTNLSQDSRRKHRVLFTYTRTTLCNFLPDGERGIEVRGWTLSFISSGRLVVKLLRTSS